MFEQISIFDMIEPESRFTAEMKCGSGFAEGRVRIYFASCRMDVKELADFMKDEYGTGGHSITYPDGASGFADHNPKGIFLSVWKTNETEKHTWKEAAIEAKRLIASGDYISEKDWKKIQEIQQMYADPKPVPRLSEKAWSA